MAIFFFFSLGHLPWQFCNEINPTSPGLNAKQPRVKGQELTNIGNIWSQWNQVCFQLLVYYLLIIIYFLSAVDSLFLDHLKKIIEWFGLERTELIKSSDSPRQSQMKCERWVYKHWQGGFQGRSQLISKILMKSDPGWVKTTWFWTWNNCQRL